MGVVQFTSELFVTKGLFCSCFGLKVGETAFVSDNDRIRRSAGVIILLDLGVVLLLVAEVILMSGVMTVILVMVKEVRNISGSSLLGKVTGSSGC